MFDSNKNISELKIYLKKTVSVTRNNNIVEEPTIGDQGDVMSKYPKTDYTYSRLSKDRVELAPGQIAVPNMSRPSLHSVRHSLSSQDLNVASTTSSYFSDSELRQRWLSSTQNTYQNSRGFDGMSDSEVDETDNWRQQSSVNLKTDNRWKIVKLMTFIWTTIVTTTTTVTSKLFGSDGGAARHHYTNNYYTYSSINTNKTRYSAFKEKMKKKRVWIPLLFLLFLLPALIYWWPLLGLFNKDAEETKFAPIVVSDKFEMTEEMINQIVLRVKQSLPPPTKPEPVVIEKIIETNNVVDKELLSDQQALINKLSAEIILLKNKDHSIDQDQLSTLISDHVTRSVIQILGLKSNNKDEIENDLFNKQREYVDDRVSGVKEAIMWDLRNLDQSIREDIKGIKDERALGGAFIQNSEPGDGGCHCDERIKQIVRDALLVYDADKTGLVDYAMESAGGQIISTRCTQSYQTNSAVISLFGIPLWHPSNSPRTVLTPGASPGDCWAFQGFPGYLVIKLFHRIDVTGFTLEHVSHLLSPRGQIESAPKNFTVWGLQDELDKEPFLFGSYEYRNDSSPEQYFAVQNHDVNGKNELPGHEFVELRIESNHGNPVYTCLYRFRVHGDPIDSAYYQLNGQ